MTLYMLIVTILPSHPDAIVNITPYMCLGKRKTVIKVLLTSQFGYCPLVWIVHTKYILCANKR